MLASIPKPNCPTPCGVGVVESPLGPHQRGSSASALVWTFLGTFARIGAQFVIGLTMARWLGPRPYGLIAASLIPISMAGLITNGGLATAMIQKRDLNQETISGVWWVQVGLGSVMALATILAAPWICRGLDQPEAIPVMRAMALGLPIGAAGGVSGTLLMRDLRSVPVQVASVLSYLLGYGVLGLWLAHAGAGVWAIAGSQLAQSLINAAILMGAARPALNWPRWPNGVAGFGAWVLAGNLTSWAHANAHQILSSRFLGALALGHYNRFGLITELPISVFAGPIQQVLFPSVARSESSHQKGELTCASLVGIGWVFMPAMGFLALNAGLVTGVLYGPAFATYADMLPPMALAAMLTALSCVSGPVLSGLGRPRDEWTVQVATFTASIPILLLTVRHGVVALCWGLMATAGLRFLLGSVALHRAGAATLLRQGQAVAKAALPSVVGLFVGKVLQLWLAPLGGASALVLGILATLVGCLGILLLGWCLLVPSPIQRLVRQQWQKFSSVAISLP